MEKDKQRKILGVRVDNLDKDQVMARVEDLIETGGCHLVVTLNPEILMAARNDPEFAEIINQKAALVVADGVGITLAAKLLGEPLKERILGRKLAVESAGLCHRLKKKILLLGGRPGIAQAALENLQRQFPGLAVLADSRPTKTDIFSQDELRSLADLVKKEKPAMVLVALDFCQREKFILRLINLLKQEKFPYGMIFVGIGGALDYLAGKSRAVPQPVSQLGLEWLWRLATEPRKRFFRQARALPVFACGVFAEVLRRKIK
jgi:N-acetylglucosaminyldiphosphoundecaprenol N-acetyl-beta-D-mannosaminyltransferase